MAFHTGNRDVVEKLQTALEAFMKDHRVAAQADKALWAERTEGLTAEEVEGMSGCGCDDCVKAGELLGSIY